MSVKGWVATAAKEKMVLQDIDLGPLGTEDVEVAVEHCGRCHSDVSVLNNEWAISQYPAVLGHEVVGRVTATGTATNPLLAVKRPVSSLSQCHSANSC
jgi:alcohol/geraniol dehydrogenase (NADP+)